MTSKGLKRTYTFLARWAILADNWKAIASQVKAEAKGLCQRCGWVCDGSSRDRFLQVHHWDMKPENNERSNLVALCPACHLDLHRGGKGNVSEGQTALFLSTGCGFSEKPASILTNKVQWSIQRGEENRFMLIY